jgi:hypothetical protein
LINIANEFHLLIIYLESDIKHLQSATAKSQINEFSDKFGVNRDTLTNYPSCQSDMQVQEGEVKYRSSPSASYHQMSSERNTTGAVTRSHRLENVTTDNGNKMDISDDYHALGYSFNDDDDDAKSSCGEDIDFMCKTKKIQESKLLEMDRSKKKKKKSVASRKKKE